MENQTNIPQLRFPEFNEEWEMKKLGEAILSIESGTSVNSVDEPVYQENEFGILKTSCISGGQFFPNENKKILASELSRAALNPTKDSILVSRMNTPLLVGENGYIDKEHKNLFIPDRLWLLKTLPDNTSRFLNYILTTQKIRAAISNIATGTSNSMKNISQPSFLALKSGFPTLPEQTKIANFLTAVDEKLQALKKKKSLLENYKKGVMQKCLNYDFSDLYDENDFEIDNEKIKSKNQKSNQSQKSNKSRFRQEDGSNFPEWETKKLGEVCEIFDGTHQTPSYVSEGIPFYSVEQLTANDFTKTKFITKEIFEKENKRVKIEKGDILMTRIGDIGTSRYIDWEANASFYVSIVLIKQSAKINSKFIHHFIGSKFFQNELWNRTIHVAFPKKINLGEIGNCLINLPCLAEQTKIANFLSAIDEKINHNNTQIQKTEQWKKGLLQKMFV